MILGSPLLRNERARRRRALKHVLKPLPVEIEQMTMDYVHKPYCDRTIIDVGMKWQRHGHPIAKLLQGYVRFRPGAMKVLWLKPLRSELIYKE